MREVVSTSVIDREVGWLYFITPDDEVARVREDEHSEPEILKKLPVHREPGFIYFFDEAGDLVRQPTPKPQEPPNTWRPSPGETYRTLSVQQPYAEQILNGTKPIEYRTWSTPHRGPVLLNASATKNNARIDDAIADGTIEKAKLNFGGIIGAFEIVDVTGVKGDYEWLVRPLCRLPFKKAKGKLNLYQTTWTNETALFKTGITREADYLYFLDDKMRVARSKDDEVEVLLETGLVREDGFLYFIDVNGDVARSEIWPVERVLTLFRKHTRKRELTRAELVDEVVQETDLSATKVEEHLDTAIARGVITSTMTCAARTLNEHTRDQLRFALDEVAREGMTRDELSRAVNAYFGFTRLGKGAKLALRELFDEE